MSDSFEVEFIGGPLDGINLVHPEERYLLRVVSDPSGHYEYRPDLRYHWVTDAVQSNWFDQPPEEPF